MTAAIGDADLVHSHTWYANMAGHWSKLLYDVPHVVTAHSLEPRRPWKAEQLGGGYRVSSWAESTGYHGADAVVAVSEGMRADILDCYPDLDPSKVHVILNGIDTEIYQPTFDRTVLIERGVDLDAPIASFVGRITRQKGVRHLIAAAHEFDPEVQLVLCAGAPDTPEIAAETAAAVQALQRSRPGVFWFDGMLTLDQVKQVLSASTVFCCPSVYEPLGIVNLEAMACGAAVVASDVGGIPEVVQDGITGDLVHYDESDAGDVRGEHRRRGQRGGRRPRAGGPVRAGRPATGRDRVLLDHDRRADGGALPVPAALIDRPDTGPDRSLPARDSEPPGPLDGGPGRRTGQLTTALSASPRAAPRRRRSRRPGGRHLPGVHA